MFFFNFPRKQKRNLISQLSVPLTFNHLTYSFLLGSWWGHCGSGSPLDRDGSFLPFRGLSSISGRSWGSALMSSRKRSERNLTPEVFEEILIIVEQSGSWSETSLRLRGSGESVKRIVMEERVVHESGSGESSWGTFPENKDD